MASSSITARQIEVEKMETVIDFLFLGSKITADSDCSHEIRRQLLLGRNRRDYSLVKFNSSVLSLFYCPTLTSVHDYWKNHSFKYVKIVGKMMSLLSNTLSRFDIAFLPRSKCFWIPWLSSLSTVILEPKKIKSVTVSTFSLFIYHEMMELDAMILVFFFFNVVLSQLFHFPLSPSSRVSLVPFHFLPWEWDHLHIWGCWYFSW